MRVALEDGDDAFVLWHLTHCRSKSPKWLTDVAIACSRVTVLTHLLSRGTALVSSGPRGVIEEAAAQDAMRVVQWLHETVAGGWTSKAMDKAVEHGRLDVVKWLHTNRAEGCTVDAMDKAAENGHVAVVQWLHANRLEGYTVKAMIEQQRRVTWMLSNDSTRTGQRVVLWLQ